MRKSADSFTIVIRLARTRKVTGETPRRLLLFEEVLSQPDVLVSSLGKDGAAGIVIPLTPFFSPSKSLGILKAYSNNFPVPARHLIDVTPQRPGEYFNC